VLIEWAQVASHSAAPVGLINSAAAGRGSDRELRAGMQVGRNDRSPAGTFIVGKIEQRD
jgi:hypothetical protein